MREMYKTIIIVCENILRQRESKMEREVFDIVLRAQIINPGPTGVMIMGFQPEITAFDY